MYHREGHEIGRQPKTSWSGTTCKAAARVARASLALQVSRFAVRQPPYSGPDRAPADKERDIPVS